jgi:hypothetical protein
MLAVLVALRQIARADTVDGSSAMPKHLRYLLEALRDDGELTLTAVTSTANKPPS